MVQGEAKLFLGQVTFDATKEDIIRLFSAYGDVIHVQLLWDHGRQCSRGAAFVTYGSTEEADTAIAALHDRYPTLPGRCLQVSYAKNSPNISAYGHHMAVDVATRNGSNPMPGTVPSQSPPLPPPNEGVDPLAAPTNQGHPPLPEEFANAAQGPPRYLSYQRPPPRGVYFC